MSNTHGQWLDRIRGRRRVMAEHGRLIDADVLKAIFAMWEQIGGYSECEFNIIRAAMYECDIAPTIEPERKKGKWQRVSPEKYTHSSDYVFRCNQCSEVFIGAWNFCANCGADMRGEQDEDR